MIIYTNVKKVLLWATALCAIAVLPLLSGCPTGHKSSSPPPARLLLLLILLRTVR